MYIIGLTDIDNVCRICFEVDAVKKSLYTDKELNNMSLADILLSCFQIKVDQHEFLTNMVCKNCIEEIYRIYEFKLKLEKSVNCWREYLLNVENDSIKKDDFLVVLPKSEVDSLKSSAIELSMESLKQVELDVHEMPINDNSDSKLKTSKSYICQQCKAEFVNKLQLMKHKRIFSHYKRKRIPCPKCSLLICTQNYKEHLLKHAEDHICELCGKMFSNKFNLERHIRIHTKETPFTCSFCNAKFARHDNLKAHQMTHMSLNAEESLLCSECGKSYANQIKLKMHKKCVHDRVAVPPKEHLCNICAKLYSSRTVLKQHIQTIHLGVRSYACKYCDKSFSQSGSLQSHYVTHSGEKPYACHICSRAFNRPQNLQRHVKTHTNERPYKCTLCTKAFTEKQSLTVHIRTHTGDRPYSCPECNKRFIDCGTMNKHRKIHLNQSINKNM